MKIGKITQDGYGNYGNILQNYALQEYLLQYVDEVDTIWHTPSELLGNYWKWENKERIKYLLNYKNFRTNIKNGYHAWEYVRNARFYDFSQKYIHNVNPEGCVDRILNNYDFFVVGSDQVWRPSSKRLEIGFLKFAPREKRISYAASMGVEIIPEEKEEYFKNALNEMAAISVREESAAKIVKDLTGKNCTVVMDPCFALDAMKWRNLADVPYWTPSKYMFSYFLGPVPKEIDRIAKKYGLDNVKVFDKENFYHATMSPQEWIALIDNAEIIYTDSFHCTVFSMIFNKPFVVCDRIGNLKVQQMRTRFETLLSRYNMQERFTNDITHYEVVNPFMTDYSTYSSVLKDEHAKADRFIRKSLNLNI